MSSVFYLFKTKKTTKFPPFFYEICQTSFSRCSSLATQQKKDCQSNQDRSGRISRRIYPYVRDRRTSAAEYLYRLVRKRNENSNKSRRYRAFCPVFCVFARQKPKYRSKCRKFTEVRKLANKMVSFFGRTLLTSEEVRNKMTDRARHLSAQHGIAPYKA